MLEGGKRIVLGYTSNYRLSITVSEALGKTLSREVEALKDHLGNGGTLQGGRVRLEASQQESGVSTGATWRWWTKAGATGSHFCVF